MGIGGLVYENVTKVQGPRRELGAGCKPVRGSNLHTIEIRKHRQSTRLQSRCFSGRDGMMIALHYGYSDFGAALCRVSAVRDVPVPRTWTPDWPTQATDPEEDRQGPSLVQGAIFALFGLLVAFTFRVRRRALTCAEI